jgi:Flp pilus assembly protein TadD/thioredoxin-related protein
MIRSLVLLVLTACALGVLTPRHAIAAAAELVPWDQSGTFASILAKAKKQKKLVFVDVYATWCGPCKMMDKQVYTDSSVAKVAAAFVNRKLDAEKGEGPGIATKYNVTAFPTLLVLDGDGKEKNRQVGFMPADRFARFLDDTRTGRGTIEGIQALIAKGEDTAANRFALSKKFTEQNQLAEASAEFERGLALDPADAESRGAEAVIAITGQAVQQQAFDAAAPPLEAWVRSVPASHPKMPEVLLQQATLYANSGKNAEAVETLRKVLTLKPDDAALLSSFARYCARTNQALDDALAAATKAVGITNGDATALDALAEVHGARGDWTLAVETAEKALAARPNDGYLRGQLERYQEQAVANLNKPKTQ